MWSYLLAVTGLAAVAATARRPRLGWTLHVTAQTLWVVYAIRTAQWGFLITAVAYGAVYLHLLCTTPVPAWEPDQDETEDPCRPTFQDETTRA